MSCLARCNPKEIPSNKYELASNFMKSSLIIHSPLHNPKIHQYFFSDQEIDCNTTISEFEDIDIILIWWIIHSEIRFHQIQNIVHIFIVEFLAIVIVSNPYSKKDFENQFVIEIAAAQLLGWLPACVAGLMAASWAGWVGDCACLARGWFCYYGASPEAFPAGPGLDQLFSYYGVY